MLTIELITILVTIAGLFIWNRAEARADARHMDTKLEGFRAVIDAIKEEMKDFHNRLCDIESKRNKK